LGNYSRILHHLDMKDVKKRHLKERAAKKIKEENNRKEAKAIQEIAKKYKSNWREELINEGEWQPVASGAPTNAVTQTFGYFDGGFPVPNSQTGQQVTTTLSGIGLQGVESSTTIDLGFGETMNVDAPTFNQLAMAGYTPPLKMMRRGTPEDTNPKLDASQQFVQKIGADVMMNARVDPSGELEEKYQKFIKERDAAQRHNEKMAIRNFKKVTEYVNSLNLGIDTRELRREGSLYIDGGAIGYREVDDKGNIEIGVFKGPGITVVGDGIAVNNENKITKELKQFNIREGFKKVPVMPDELIQYEQDKATIEYAKTEEFKQELKFHTQKDISALKKLGIEGKVFANYLINNLPSVIDNNYLGSEFVKMAFKKMVINKFGNTVVGDNIIGSGQPLVYKDGQVILNFNYDFDTNVQQIEKEPDKYDFKNPITHMRMIATMMLGGPGGRTYGLDSAGVPFAATAIALSKLFGGGKQTKGQIKMSVSEFSKLNETAYAELVNKGVIPLGAHRDKSKSVKTINKIKSMSKERAARKALSLDEPIVRSSKKSKKKRG